MKRTKRVAAWRWLERFWDHVVARWEYQWAALRDVWQEMISPELSPQRRRRFIPEFEQLEIRWLPAPTVSLTAPANANTGAFYVTVTASGSNMPATPIARLDVDLNNDGNFTDAGEQNYTTTNMSGSGIGPYTATFQVSPALSNGTYPERARVIDNLNQTGTSSTQTTVVNTSPTNWLPGGQIWSSDPKQGLLIPAGPANVQWVSPQTGDVRTSFPLDFDLSPGTSVSSLNGETAARALVYNSDSISPQPIIEGTLASDPSGSVPSSIKVQLTFNGVAQSWVTFSTTGHSAGDTYLLAAEDSTAVTSTGVYSWQLYISAQFTGANSIDRVVSGSTFVVVNGSSDPFGYGWSIAGLDQLVPVTGGIWYVYGTGGSRFFSGSGPNYTSPANDFGTLVKNGDSSYTYTTPDTTKFNFSSSGLLTSVVDPHSLALTYTYSSGLLTNVATPDGGLATLSYSGGLLTKITEPGGRVVTTTFSSNNLTGIQDPTGGLRTLSYDSLHHLTNDQWSPLNVTLQYDSNSHVLTQWGWLGQNGTFLISPYSITPEAVRGLATSPALNSNQAVGIVTNPLNNPITYTLDTLARLTKLQWPDVTTQTWQLNSAGLPTLYTDQLGRMTTVVYDTVGDRTQITFPDGSNQNYQYDSTFHRLTQIQDTLGKLTTVTLGSQGDVASIKNALNQITTFSWSTGLLQSITDPLNNTTTFLDDINRRIQTIVDPLNDRSTLSYDTSGNLSSMRDALGRVSTTVFDAMNRLVKVITALGGITTLTYNAIGETLSVTDPLGHTKTMTYDQRGLRLATVYPILGDQSNLAYDAAGQLTTKTDPNGHTWTFAYDPVGRLRTRTSPVGGVETFTYDLDGELIAYADANNNSTLFGYNVRGWQTTITDVFSHNTTLAYDTNGNLTLQIDRNGNRTTMAYDALNRLTQTTNALGGMATLIYDAAGNLSASVDELSGRTTYSYDPLNRLTQTMDALGGLATIIYDALGNETVSVDQLGNRTTMAYDALNRMTTSTDPMNFVVTMAYDAASNEISVTNGRGYTTSFAYDKLNRLTQITNPLGGLVTIVYDLANNVTNTIDERGDKTTLIYDAANRLTGITDPLGHTGTIVYDLAGNIIKQIDPLGYTTTMTYDGDNRLISAQDPGGGIATLVYDNVGNVTSRIDQLGNKTTYVFDALNRQTQAIDPRGGITTTLFDAVGNMTNVIDSVGNKTTFVFDALNREIQEIDPFGNLVTLAYDKASRLTSRTDRDGRRIDYSYDKDNRETGETWVSSGSTANLLTLTYDQNSNLLTAGDYRSLYTMTYDALDRLVTQQDMWGMLLTSAYDAVGNRTQLQDSFGGTLTSVYDATNRLTTREFSNGGQNPLRIDLGYNARDQITTETRYTDLAGSNKVGSTTLTYDGVGRLTNLQHFNGSMTILANYTYTYDLASRLSTETLNGTTTTYQYDTTNQLTSDTANNYSYDLTGNRTMSGYQTGKNNQITTDGTYSYTYDQEGNLLTKTNISTLEKWTFGYDNLNHMISAVDKNSSGTTLTLATYIYDVFGDRIEKDVWTSGSGTTTTRFAYDLASPPLQGGRGTGVKGTIWADLNSSNGLLMRYILGDHADQLFARISGSGATAWYLTDRLGSVRDITDNTGVVIDHINYDGFGNVTLETQSANGGRWKWTGREFDAETGFEFNRARYFDPKTGRWTSQDPTGFAAGDANLYRYVINNPTNHTDPTGLDFNGDNASYAAAGAIIGTAIVVSVASGGVVTPLAVTFVVVTVGIMYVWGGYYASDPADAMGTGVTAPLEAAMAVTFIETVIIPAWKDALLWIRIVLLAKEEETVSEKMETELAAIERMAPELESTGVYEQPPTLSPPNPQLANYSIQQLLDKMEKYRRQIEQLEESMGDTFDPSPDWKIQRYKERMEAIMKELEKR